MNTLPEKRGIFPILKETVRDWMDDNALRLSAALAYYSIFSIAPLLVISIAIAGWVLGPQAAQDLLNDQLRGFVGTQAADGIQEMVKSASKPSSSILAGIMGGIALLFGASGVFGQLKDALNTIWEVRPKSGQGIMKFIRERILSFGMVLVIGFLLLVSLLLTTMLTGLTKNLGSWLPISETLVTVLSSVCSFGVVAVLFAAIFKFLPDAKVRWRDVWIGAVATALLFEVGKFLLGLYLGRESTASAYGAAASAVLVLLWVYYASCILFFGAEFTQVYAKAHGSQIQPDEHAEPVTEEARAQQGLEPEKASDQPAEEKETRKPAKESVIAAMPEAYAKLSAQRDGHHFVEEYAIPLTFAALGSGLAIGAILRRFEAGPSLTPTEQVKEGSKALLLAGSAATAAFFGSLLARTRKALEPDHLRQTGKWLAEKMDEGVVQTKKAIATTSRMTGRSSRPIARAMRSVRSHFRR